MAESADGARRAEWVREGARRELRGALGGLRAALALLTRLPLGAADESAAARLRAPLFFPCAGVVVGVALAAAERAGAALLPPLLGAVALVALWVWLSGALHLDGLCDSFDALMSGRRAEGALQVLRDPRAGTAGVVAISLVLLAKVAALGSLSAELRPRALVAAAVLGRAWLVPALALPLARSDGMARAFRGPHIARQAALALLAAALLASGLCGSAGAAAAVLTALPVAWLLRAAWLRLGGTTGDVCGAAAELAEAAFLVALASAEFRGRVGALAASPFLASWP